MFEQNLSINSTECDAFNSVNTVKPARSQDTQARVLELAQALIRKVSITPSDQGCCDLIAKRLADIGFEIEFLNKGMVSNLWAKRGNNMPKLVFSGHTDVVPAGKESTWKTPAFIPIVRDGYLFGRGAADMKGSLAAMLVAAEDFVAQYPQHKHSLGFMITSDEEGEALDGTAHIVETLKKRQQTIDYCIVGEPTSSKALGDSIRIGRRGSINCQIKIKGKQGHVGYPEHLVNPIHQSSKLISKLSNKLWDLPSRYFPATSCQLVKLSSDSGALNVTPADLEIVLNFRYSPKNSFAKIKQYVEAKIHKYGLQANIDWQHEAEPYLTKRGHLRKSVQQIISQQTGNNPKLTTAGGISDGRYAKIIAEQVIELGPCNKTIHQANECVKVDDLLKLSELYFAIMKKLLV